MTNNPCRVVITRGKNKGKICGFINSKCKHVAELLICNHCGLKFDRTTSYYRHVNQCNTTSSSNKQSKIKISVNVKNNSDELESEKKNISTVFQRLAELEEQNTALREEVEVLKHKPVNNFNIAILGNDFYTELVQKIGKSDAIKFLAQSCAKSPLDVFQKLYLDDCKPDDYPVACREGPQRQHHFRYLGHDKKMVDDKGGSTIGRAVSKQIANAMLDAVNDFNENMVYYLDDVETIRKRLQDNIDKERIVNDLAYITKNPHHPFFRENI